MRIFYSKIKSNNGDRQLNINVNDQSNEFEHGMSPRSENSRNNIRDYDIKMPSPKDILLHQQMVSSQINPNVSLEHS